MVTKARMGSVERRKGRGNGWMKADGSQTETYPAMGGDSIIIEG